MGAAHEQCVKRILQSENADLRDQRLLDQDNGRTSETPASPTAPTGRGVQLTSDGHNTGQGFDFETSEIGLSNTVGVDLYVYATQLASSASRVAAVTGNSFPSEEECASALDSGGRRNLGDFDERSYVCLMTSDQGSMAAIYITDYKEFGSSSASSTFDYIPYE